MKDFEEAKMIHQKGTEMFLIVEIKDLIIIRVFGVLRILKLQ